MIIAVPQTSHQGFHLRPRILHHFGIQFGSPPIDSGGIRLRNSAIDHDLTMFKTTKVNQCGHGLLGRIHHVLSLIHI